MTNLNKLLERIREEIFPQDPEAPLEAPYPVDAYFGDLDRFELEQVQGEEDLVRLLAGDSRFHQAFVNWMDRPEVLKELGEKSHRILRNRIGQLRGPMGHGLASRWGKGTFLPTDVLDEAILPLLDLIGTAKRAKQFSGQLQVPFSEILQLRRIVNQMANTGEVSKSDVAYAVLIIQEEILPRLDTPHLQAVFEDLRDSLSKLGGAKKTEAATLDTRIDSLFVDDQLYQRTFDRYRLGLEGILRKQGAFHLDGVDEEFFLAQMQYTAAARYPLFMQFFKDVLIPRYPENPVVLVVGAGFESTPPGLSRRLGRSGTSPQAIEVAALLPPEGRVVAIDLSAYPLNAVVESPPMLWALSSQANNADSHYWHQIIQRAAEKVEMTAEDGNEYLVLAYPPSVAERISVHRMDIATDSYDVLAVNAVIFTGTGHFLPTEAGDESFWETVNLLKMMGVIKKGGHLIVSGKSQGLDANLLSAFGFRAVTLDTHRTEPFIHIYERFEVPVLGQKLYAKIEKEQARAREAVQALDEQGNVARRSEFSALGEMVEPAPLDLGRSVAPRSKASSGPRNFAGLMSPDLEVEEISPEPSLKPLFQIVGTAQPEANVAFRIVGAREEVGEAPQSTAEADLAAESLVKSAGLFGVGGTPSALKAPVHSLALRVMR